MATFGRGGSRAERSRSDAELAASAAAADQRAFGELYRRHSEAAWRVAFAVAGNVDDAADAVSEAFTGVLTSLPGGRLADGERFRPYLLAATRNAAVDRIRRGGRLRPGDPASQLDPTAAVPRRWERLARAQGSAIFARAFRSLPERWRSVLWLVEVEAMPAGEVGPLMGLSANSASQLAVRARAGLVERYLQSHLGARIEEACRFCVEHLGAYAAGRLVPRHHARVERHLAGCEECRGRLDDIRDVGSALSHVAVPLPLFVAADASARWQTATAATTSASPWAAPVTSPAMERLQKPLLALSSGIFALGVISATVVDGTGRAPHRRTLDAAALQAGPQRSDDVLAAVIDLRPVAVEVIPVDDPDPGPAGDPVGSGPEVEAASSAPAAPAALLQRLPAPPPGPAAPAVEPAILDVHAEVADVPVEVSVGAGEYGCSGVAIGELAFGCTGDPGGEPPAATGPVAVTVSTATAPLGSHGITIDPL